jgi:SnoaL-like domain
MSREQKIAVVEAYLECFATKALSKVSFAEDVTFEGPRMPKLTGRATILGFLTQVLPVVRGIQLKQYIVEGDYVSTIFDMETVNGVDHVFDRIHIEMDRLRPFMRSITPSKRLRDKPSRRTLLSNPGHRNLETRWAFHKGSFVREHISMLDCDRTGHAGPVYRHSRITSSPHFSRGSRQEVKTQRRKSGKRPLFSWHNCVVQT